MIIMILMKWNDDEETTLWNWKIIEIMVDVPLAIHGYGSPSSKILYAQSIA